jgi:hypothetical protein
MGRCTVEQRADHGSCGGVLLYIRTPGGTIVAWYCGSDVVAARSGWAHLTRNSKTEPNRNRIEMSVFRFLGSALVFIFGRFDCRFGDRFWLPTEPKNRTDRRTGALRRIHLSYATARLCSLPFPTMGRGPVGCNDHGTKAHHAMPLVPKRTR